jgi:hypothetical protein
MTKSRRSRKQFQPPITFNVVEIQESTRLTEQGRYIKQAKILLPNGMRWYVDLQRIPTPHSFEFEGKTYYIQEKEYEIYKEAFLEFN